MALSGGQQQRLCIARTIAPAPDVMLLDEPTASLDPQGTQRIEELLYQLKRDFTIIIVTHNMQQAARVSERTTLLLSRTMVETGADPGDLHRTEERGDRSLHHGTVRMTTTMSPRPFVTVPKVTLAPRLPSRLWRVAAVRPSTCATSISPMESALRSGISTSPSRKTVTAVIGPSGCGKSTFLRSINRLNDLIPGIRHQGDILVEGTSVFTPTPTSSPSVNGWEWCSSGPTRFPSRSSRTWRTGRRSTRWCPARPAGSGRAVPPAGRAVGRSEGPAGEAGHADSPAASSSGSASPGHSRTSPRSC